MAGAIDADLRKFHTSLNVASLARSIPFYRALLGVEPAKVRADYAKFDLAEPPLVLSLVPGQGQPGGALNHAGLRVRNAEELVAMQHRLEAAGMPTQREEGVECCYALQTKFWISDPDGVLWEIYVFHEDIDEHGDAAPPRTAPARPATTAAALAWSHHLRDPIPERIPHEDHSLREVRLEGSINLLPDAPHRAGLFSEALRALRPGSAVHVRGLAGDDRSVRQPTLPGPAAAVQYVPATADVIDELVGAGFIDVRIEKLSPTAHFVVENVPMRELRVVAHKPGHRPRARLHHAVYLGPLSAVTDDYGTVFRRGVPTAVNVHDWQVLKRGSAKESFLFLAPGAVEAGCCGDAQEVPTAANARR
jgi:catechol 2,3-dioxygenase-like lactoylglutathione lyase family enzyme